jgi:hypothetical protein
MDKPSGKATNMPKEEPGRRGRKDEELWIRNYDRKPTIFQRLGINPQLLSIGLLGSVCVLSILLGFSLWEGSQRLDMLNQLRASQTETLTAKDRKIKTLEDQNGSLTKQAASLSDKNVELKGQVDSLTTKVTSLSSKKCDCKQSSAPQKNDGQLPRGKHGNPPKGNHGNPPPTNN